jgi:hypothetical protein
MSSLREASRRHLGTSAFAYARLAFYPLTLLVWGPVRLALTLEKMKLLASGKISQFNRYRPQNGVNSLTYWTMALNLDRYGRSSVSPTTGLGQFRIAQWIELTALSYYLYWRSSVITVPAAMFVLVVCNGLWLTDAYGTHAWMLGVLALSVISTTFFGAAFVFLNYNAFGWAIFPALLWALFHGNHLLAALLLFLLSFTSVTVLVLSVLLTVAFAVIFNEPALIAATVPAIVKFATHFLVAGARDAMARMVFTLKSIGAMRATAKYRRKTRITIAFCYFLALYLLFLWLMSALPDHVRVLWAIGIAVFVANGTVFRFADPQSMYMLMYCLSTAIVMQTPENWSLLAAYWVVVSPLPVLLGDSNKGGMFEAQPPLRPFRVQALLDRVELFLAEVQKGSRVLFAFKDPAGIYENVFDGYSVLHELPCYVAARKGLHVFPDWWAVFEANAAEVRPFWGVDPAAVLRHALDYAAEHVVIYTASAEQHIGESWLGLGFVAKASLDWSEMDEDLRGERIWTGCTPKWWLLAVPAGQPEFGITPARA